MEEKIRWAEKADPLKGDLTKADLTKGDLDKSVP